MKKEELLAFVKNTQNEKESIQELTEKKITEFVDCGNKLFHELEVLMNKYFPLEIENLFFSLIPMDSSIQIGDLVFLNYSKNVRIQLENKKNTRVFYRKGMDFSDNVRIPNDIDTLLSGKSILKRYSALKEQLENNIEKFYQQLYQLKNEELNKDLQLLHELNFETSTDIQKASVNTTEEEAIARVLQMKYPTMPIHKIREITNDALQCVSVVKKYNGVIYELSHEEEAFISGHETACDWLSPVIPEEDFLRYNELLIRAMIFQSLKDKESNDENENI